MIVYGNLSVFSPFFDFHNSAVSITLSEAIFDGEASILSIFKFSILYYRRLSDGEKNTWKEKKKSSTSISWSIKENKIKQNKMFLLSSWS